MKVSITGYKAKSESEKQKAKSKKQKAKSEKRKSESENPHYCGFSASNGAIDKICGESPGHSGGMSASKKRCIIAAASARVAAPRGSNRPPGLPFMTPAE